MNQLKIYLVGMNEFKQTNFKSEME